MPNWVIGMYAIKGTKKNVLNFLNEGLKNSGIEPKENCEEAFDALLENAKTKVSNFFISNPDGRKGDKFENPADIIYAKGLTLDTFRPMPDTFLMYDTTNYSKTLEEVVKKQLKEYGVVGWYEYGTDVLRGTKWDADLENVKLDVSKDEDVATFRFCCDTAWSVPTLWLEWVKKTFKVNVLLCVHEESNAFNFYGEIDMTKEDFGSLNCGEGKPTEEDFEDEHDYWDALYDWETSQVEEMQSNFSSYVEEFEIDTDFEE
jgi:hypothetical protein